MELGKISKLIEKILEKTNKEEIKWNMALFDEDEFQTSFPNQTVGIQKTMDFGGNEYITLKIYNMKGVLIDEFGGETTFDKDNLNNLFHIVRRKILGLDNAVDDILDNLGE